MKGNDIKDCFFCLIQNYIPWQFMTFHKNLSVENIAYFIHMILILHMCLITQVTYKKLLLLLPPVGLLWQLKFFRSKLFIMFCCKSLFFLIVSKHLEFLVFCFLFFVFVFAFYSHIFSLHNIIPFTQNHFSSFESVSIPLLILLRAVS